MKINFSDYDLSEFIQRPCTIGGVECVLIFPNHIGVKWTRKNLLFRSSIWTTDGELVSASFKKFFNWGEQPDLAYTPFSLTANGGVKIMEKLDGSTLVVSKFHDELIVRTRGTVSAEGMENGYEIDFLKEKYPLVFDLPKDENGTCNRTYIYEWTSPVNKIVIQYPEPDIYLTAIINHEDYSLVPQDEVDEIAQKIGVKRPRRFTFNTFDEMFEAIAALGYEETKTFGAPKEIVDYVRKNHSERPLATNFEGFCVYCNKDRDIRKVKGAWYLAVHKMKSELSSFDKVVDLWATLDYPDYQTFYNHVETFVDYEVAQSARGDISRVCNAKVEIDRIVDYMKSFVEKLDENLQPTNPKKRAEYAKRIHEAYGNTNRASYVFSILDGKSLTRDQYKKLLFQVLKK